MFAYQHEIAREHGSMSLIETSSPRVIAFLSAAVSRCSFARAARSAARSNPPCPLPAGGHYVANALETRFH